MNYLLLGGATSILTSHLDERFKAAICLDTWMFPIQKEVVASGLKNTPLLLSVSEEVYFFMNFNHIHSVS